MTPPLRIAILGLTLSSSWGNGHATTYRALLRGLAARRHRVLFLERDMPWYAEHRDLPAPGFCDLRYYESVDDIRKYRAMLENADAVIVGSYVPDGAQVIDLLSRFTLDRFCFYDIDTPVTLASLKRGEEEFLARRQIPSFDVYFSFSGGDVLDRLEREFGARRAEALYCSVDEKEHRSTGEAMLWDLGYLGTYSDDRQLVLERLLIEPARRLPHRRFVVAGAQYPQTIDWPANVDRIQHLPPSEHASFYSRQRFTLNVTRADMTAAGWSPSVRLFEAGACGTPVIGDRWPGLTEFFPEGEAILVPETPGAVAAILENMPDDERRRLARNARNCVISAHTGAVRASELVDHLLAIERYPQQRVSTAI